MSDDREAALKSAMDEAHAEMTERGRILRKVNEENNRLSSEYNELRKKYDTAQRNYEMRDNCKETVWHEWSSSRCTRKRGYGPNEDYCKQHARKYDK
jgi:thymidylate synthase